MNRGHIKPYGEGQWRLWVYAGTDPVTGRRRQKTKVVTGSRREAEKVLTRLLAEVDAGRHGGTSSRTFGDVLDAWLVHKGLSVEASTLANYRHQVGYVPDRLRSMPVTKVDVEHLEAFYAHLFQEGHKRPGKLHGSGLSAKAVHNVHLAVHGAFELARRRKWVAVNPAADAEFPELRRREPTPVPPASLRAILVAAAEIHEDLPIYVRTSAVIGARLGEMHGLRWSDVDLAHGVLTLRQVIIRTDDGWVVKPRTKSGKPRAVHIDPGTVRALRDLQARRMDFALACGIVLPETAFVFSDAPDGSRFWIPTTTARRFSRACVAAGLPKGTSPHDLRHMMATHAIDGGIPIPVVSARLGHAQNSTTLDVYAGRVAVSDEAVATLMAGLFDKVSDD